MQNTGKRELHVLIKDYHGKLVKEYRGSSRTGNRENQLSALTHRTNKNRETRGKSSANCHKVMLQYHQAVATHKKQDFLKLNHWNTPQISKDGIATMQTLD